MKKFFTFIAVAAMAFAAQANTLTVADGLYYSNVQPICGLYADTEGSMTQTIYPADMLTEMAGNKISKVTFYTLNDYYANNGETSTEVEDFINFENATFQLSFLEVDEQGFEEPIAIVDATPVATVTPLRGDYMVTFVLNEPFAYSGKNLLVEVICTVAGSWGQTYFIGDSAEDYNCGMYNIDNETDVTAFMPKATFTYEAGEVIPPVVDPTVKTGAPTFHGYTTDGIHAYFVEIIPTEPSTIYYRVQFGHDGEFTEWAEYEDILSYTEDGWYRVEAYAVANGKAQSEQIAYEFVVSPRTGIDEMVEGKQVAGVRYFNMAGQEMQEANGLTIVVTTYTDGTTNAVKVVK